MCIYSKSPDETAIFSIKKWSGEQLSEIFANLSDNLHHFFVENGYLCDITLKNDDGERHQPHQSSSCREEKNQQVAGRAVRLCPHHRVKMVHQLFTATNGNLSAYSLINWSEIGRASQ